MTFTLGTATPSTWGLLCAFRHLSVLMRDFGFDPPNIANLVSVEDGVNLTVNFTAQAQG